MKPKKKDNPIVNPLQTDVERYAATIDTIFTRDNLPAILAVLNALLPRDRERIKEDQFKTIISAARHDGALEIVNGVVTFVAGRNK